MKRLNFGCGNDIKVGWDNVNLQKGQGITKNFDFEKFPYPIKDDTYDYIYASNVLEHMGDVEKVVQELHRISKSGGTIHIIVPHYTNKGAYSDLQHKHYFNEVCFTELINKKTKIDKNRNFKIVKIKLTPTKIGKIFPWKIREILSLFVGGLISQIEVRLKVVKD